MTKCIMNIGTVATSGGQENDGLPHVWTDFHTQEMLRCLMSLMRRTLGPVYNQLVCINEQELFILSSRASGSATRAGGEHETPHSKVPHTLPGVEAAESGNGWCRQTEPTYACASDDSEWAVVLDARTTRQVKSDVGHTQTQERLRLCSTSLRLIKN